MPQNNSWVEPANILLLKCFWNHFSCVHSKGRFPPHFPLPSLSFNVPVQWFFHFCFHWAHFKVPNGSLHLYPLFISFIAISLLPFFMSLFILSCAPIFQLARYIPFFFLYGSERCKKEVHFDFCNQFAIFFFQNRNFFLLFLIKKSRIP